MSEGVVPDTTEVYINEGWENEGILPKEKELREFLVVEKYNDCLNQANYCYQDINGVRDNDCESIELIENIINSEGWTLYKTLHNEWFYPQLEFFKREDLVCAVCGTEINIEYENKRWVCFKHVRKGDNKIE